MSLEQSMQVSTATLRVATTRHHHTDRVSGDTYHPIYSTYCHQWRGGRWGSESTQQAWMTLKANCMFSHSWQALQNPVWDPTEHDCPERQLSSIGSTQTLPKLHLATFKLIGNYELGKGALGMLELRYEPRTEHAGIHGNPKSGNHPRTLRPIRCLEGRRAPQTGGGMGPMPAPNNP